MSDPEVEQAARQTLLSSLKRRSAAGDFKLAHDLTLLWLGQFLSRVVVFAGFAYLARTLNAREYGAVEFSLALATLGSVIIEAGFGAIGVRRIARGEASIEEMAALMPATRLVFACLVAPCILLVTLFASRSGASVTLTIWIAASMLLLPFKQEWLFQSQERMAQILASQVLRAAVFAGGVVLLVHGGRQLVFVGVAEFVSVAAAAAYLLTIQARTISPVRLDLRPAQIKALARESLFVGLLAILWPLNQYAPLLLLGALDGVKNTAHFAAAHRLLMAMGVFTYLYHFNLYPLYARTIGVAGTELGALAGASVRVTAWAGVGFALVSSVLAGPILSLLFGAPFASAAPAFALLAWSFPIALVAGHTRWMLVAAGREHDMVIAELVGAAFLAVVAPLMIHRFGGAGAAAAMLGSSLAVWGVALGRSGRLMERPPLRPCILPVLASLIALLAVRLLGLGPLGGAGLAVSLFGGTLLLFDRAFFGDLARLVTGKADRA